MAKKKRLSTWDVLARLGHTGDHDQIAQHVFESASRVTLRRDDGEQLDGDDFLVETFEALGTTKTWPACGSPEWEKLRFQALATVVIRFGREGLLDCLSVGSEGTPAPFDREPGEPRNGEQDGGESENADAPAGDDDGETLLDKDENPDPRTGVQVGRALIRRSRRNGKGWFRCVDRVTPYRVLLQWAKETCPGATAENLSALMDGLRGVRWWDDDGHIHGAEMLRVLEAEFSEGCGDEQWMLAVSDFDAAIQRLRRVFERLCLL